MAECPPGNWPERICALEAAWGATIANSGHPPLAAAMGPSFSFDAVAQALVIPTPIAPLPADTVRVADDMARATAAPTSLHQILIQTTDATNGANSLWVPTGLGIGNWTLRVGTLGTQNSNTVNITGGTITGISPPIPVASGGTGAASAPGARTNLALQTVTPVGNVIDWAQSDNFGQGIGANTAWTFANTINGKRISFVVTDTGLFTHGFPADVAWPGGVKPVPTTANRAHLYIFERIGGVVWGRGHMDYIPPV